MKLIKQTILIVLLITITHFTYAVPYGTRKTRKPVKFTGTAEVNYTVINHEPFTQILFIPELTIKKLNMGLGLYLPLEINYDNKIRTIEYNSMQAIYGKLYYLQYGFPNTAPLFAKISAVEDFTLGHGLILQRYSNTIIFPEVRKIGTEIEASVSGIHFKGIVGDISTQSVTGGRVSVNMGEVIKNQNSFISSLKIGITLVSDFNPKKRQLVVITNNYDHKIVLRENSSSALFAFGGDISLTLTPKNSVIELGVYGEFAKLNLAGEGVGYGLFGTLLSKSLGLNFKFQFRHLFNSFTPSYFDAYYTAYRSTKIDSINSQSAKMGWYAEIERSFYKDKLGFVVAYDETFNGAYKPHLYIKLYAHNVPKRVNLTLRYDRFNFQNASDLVKLENLESLFLAEFFYRLTRNIEMGIAYRKGFIREEAPSETLSNLVNITIFTKVLF